MSGIGSVNTSGTILFGTARFGDGLESLKRSLTASLGLTYTTSTSQYSQTLGLTYTIQKANTAPLLLYYLITPPSAFAINGDSSIIAPDHLTYTLRPVSGRTLLGQGVLQGYRGMTWVYSELQWSEYMRLLSYYNPQNPLVMVTYPDENGFWVQRTAVLHPPTYGSQSTFIVSNISLTFTRLL